MKKILICSISMVLLAVAGCSDGWIDTEISAIDRQANVLREQNAILGRIAAALEKIEAKGEAK